MGLRVWVFGGVLRGSWDFVTRVLNKVTIILILAYTPNSGTYNLSTLNPKP